MIVARRSENADDQLFVELVLLERTAQDLSLGHLTPELQDQLLRMQVRLRLAAVRKRSGAASEIILADEQPCGWVVYAIESEILLIEIAVLQEYRGKGIGTTIINELIGAAENAAKSLRLHVDVMNLGAIRLYERLGFHYVGSDGVQHEMERTARRGSP